VLWGLIDYHFLGTYVWLKYFKLTEFENSFAPIINLTINCQKKLF